MTTLVVTDLDGTLWDTTLRCHPQTRNAIDELLARDDVELLVATGRRRNSARRAFEMNRLQLPSVLLNGAIGFDFANDEIFHEVSFDPDDLARVLEVLVEHELGPVAYLSDTRAVAVEGVTTSPSHIDSLGQDLVWAAFDQLEGRADVLGMSMLGIEASTVRHALPGLEALIGAEVAHYADHLYPPYSLMIGPAGVTKSVGIEAYCAHRMLTPDRIVAIGDGGNDLAMLEMADVAIAVEGSDSRAVALADHLIGLPQNGGWAHVLDYL